MTQGKKPSENIAGQGKNASKQVFFAFPTMLYTLPKTDFNF